MADGKRCGDDFRAQLCQRAGLRRGRVTGERGAIPMLMYYGFELISPQFFYLSAFVLTSMVGVAIGSSLTT